ncbi:MAG: SusC/RagA family TonB-linked outer membrane protein [Prevotella sp.]
MKRKRLILFVGMCASLCCGSPQTVLAGVAPTMAQQQIKKVKGTVSDAMGGVVGATVRIKGTSKDVITDIDGNFSIDVAKGAILQISYIGYKTYELVVGDKNVYNITLQEDNSTLDEVVVVGYGTMKRSDLTGAVSSINEKAIKEGVNTSIEQALQGRIAGVQVTQNSGAPGGGISVQIRGINSLNGNEPLYIIDGIAMSGDASGEQSALASLNPSDIVSMEVLKDASATAIYGSRASNGVVLITTKRGQEGKPTIQYEGYVGWQMMPKKLDMLGLKEYAQFCNERSAIQGYGERLEFSRPELLTDGTDWQSELFSTAFMHNHSLNVNGGNKDMHYSFSGGYLDQDGISLGSGFKRVSLRTNFDTNITEWMQVGVNLYYAQTEQNTSFSEGSVISTALSQFPDVAPRNPDGSYGFPAENNFSTYYSNPIFEANMRENLDKNQSLDYNVFTNIKPVKGLNLRVEYGGSNGWYNKYYFQPEYTYGTFINRSKSERGKNQSRYSMFKQYATYDLDFLKTQHLQVMAGHEAQWGSWESLSAARYDFVSNELHSLNVGDQSTSTNSGSDASQWSIESWFGRLNYNFDNRYLLTATVRADGSSSFGKNNRWGYFPSMALAWRASNEKFLKNVQWLKNLKLRLGWGLVGNQGAGTYAYGATMANIATAWGTGYYPNNYGNENLKWETTKAWNVGLDIAAFNNRLELIVDWYYKNTDDLLMQAALPAYVIDNEGMGMSAPWVNTGSIRNVGIEFTLNTVNIAKKHFEWRTGATLSINRNKLTKLNSQNSQIFYTWGSHLFTMSEVDGPVGRFYGYNVIGMFTCEDDFYQKNDQGEFLIDGQGNRIPVARPVDTNGSLLPIAKNSVWVGDYIYEDVNNDGKIDESDRKFIGNPNPKFTFGLNNTFRYKNLELTMFINGSVGNDIYNYVAQVHSNTEGYGNKLAYVFDYARIGLRDADGSSNDISNVYITNPETTVPRITAAGTSRNDNNRVSNRFVENGSYLRLKSLSLAYNLPKKWLAPLKLDWVQVYANATNLLTITGYDGYDPEVGANGQSVIAQGIDNYRYPSPRIYTFGLKIKY